jgi:hypothetical protein
VQEENERDAKTKKNKSKISTKKILVDRMK